MEFTKIRVRNLPTEEEYIQKKNKEYQALIKIPKFSLVSNSIVALIALALIAVTIARITHYEIGTFLITIAIFGGILFICCESIYDEIETCREWKKKYTLFQTYISSDEKEKTEFVQNDTHLYGRLTNLYFMRMLKENPNPRVWLNLWGESSADLWFTYKGKEFMIPIVAKEVDDLMIEDGECIYEFDGKEVEIIYYKKPKREDCCASEVVIELSEVGQ